MNNSVKDCYGKVIGFRCHQCGQVKDRMWGTTCNGCRAANNQHDELLAEVAMLRKTISELKIESK